MLVFVFSAERLDDLCDHIPKRLIARHRCENLLACNRVSPRAAAHVNRHCIYKLSVNFRLKSAKTDVGSFVIAAAAGHPDQ